jgi:hypothetical protein
MTELTRAQKKAAKPKRKMSLKKKAAIGVSVLVLLLVWYGLQPVVITGTALFGLCRTYIELSVPYPQHLRFVDLIDNSDGKVNVDYIYTDGFGAELYTQAICTFKPDAKTGQPIMTSFRYRRGGVNRAYRFNAEDQDKINEFNKIVPIALQYPPPLSIMGIPTDIKDYKNR